MKLLSLRIPKNEYNDYLIKLECISPIRSNSCMKFLFIDFLGYYFNKSVKYIVLLNLKLSLEICACSVSQRVMRIKRAGHNDQSIKQEKTARMRA